MLQKKHFGTWQTYGIPFNRAHRVSLFRKSFNKKNENELKTSTFSGFIAIFTVYKQFFWYLNFANHRTKESFVAAKWACEYRRIFVGYLNLFRFMSVRMMPNKMQIKQRAELSLKLCSVYSEQRNWKQKVLRRNKTTCKMAKWDFTWKRG